MKKLTGPIVLAVALMSGGADALTAQVRVTDLVITTGVAAERYSGNLASVTVPVVDSSESASALLGQVGVRGALNLFDRPGQRVTGLFDFGLRQFGAEGFSLRDYTPRELVGQAEVAAWQRIEGVGNVGLELSWRGRRVDDRPPMPLFLQPGTQQGRISLRYEAPEVGGVLFDFRADAERADYSAPDRIGALDLLDRRSSGVELGAEWGDAGRFRFYSGARRTRYPRQASFDASDPFRRDRTFTVGTSWSYQNGFILQLGVEGALNRSNSKRPEYDALSASGQFTSPLPWMGLGVNVFGLVTGKSYVQESEFARLVPGEEADNASILYVDVSKAIRSNLDATLRFGWTRAETDIGDSYFERRGATFLLNFRPLG